MASENAGFVISLGHELSEIGNASFDLWTWLPSYRVAKRHHGEYASEFCPNAADAMKEAAMYLAHLKRSGSPHFAGNPLVDYRECISVGAVDESILDDQERDWFLLCPCGELHWESDHE